MYSEVDPSDPAEDEIAWGLICAIHRHNRQQGQEKQPQSDNPRKDRSKYHLPLFQRIYHPNEEHQQYNNNMRYSSFIQMDRNCAILNEARTTQ